MSLEDQHTDLKSLRTVTGKSADRFLVDVSGETVSRTASAQWREGQFKER